MQKQLVKLKGRHRRLEWARIEWLMSSQEQWTKTEKESEAAHVDRGRAWSSIATNAGTLRMASLSLDFGPRGIR